jgi:hypothetical protein
VPDARTTVAHQILHRMPRLWATATTAAKGQPAVRPTRYSATILRPTLANASDRRTWLTSRAAQLPSAAQSTRALQRERGEIDTNLRCVVSGLHLEQWIAKSTIVIA